MNLSELPGNVQIVVKVEDLQAFAEYLARQFHPSAPKPTPKTEIEQPISQPEAIVFLGKSRQTLTAWRKKGIVKAHTLGGRVYFLKSELLEAVKREK